MILQDKAVWLVFIVGSFFSFGIWLGWNLKAWLHKWVRARRRTHY